jgi:hypothetical protein
MVLIDQRKVKEPMAKLAQHTIIAYFVGGKPTSSSLSLWISELRTSMGGVWIGLGRDLGRGFF